MTYRDAGNLTERMLANTEAGFPVCAPGEHEWFGSFGVHTCAVCLIGSDELVSVCSLREGFAAMAAAVLDGS